MDYWFYLEPYTFLFRNEHEAVIYNTLNSAYLVCPNQPIVKQILEQWENVANGYGATLTRQDLENGIVRDFVITVRESFSGDCVKYDLERPKPYLFKPDLFLNTNIRMKHEKEKTSLGERILQSLHEVTVYLPTSCSYNCTACTSYYKQFIHCTICREGTLEQKGYSRLLGQLHTSGVQRVNLSGGGNPLGSNCMRQLLLDFTESNFKKHLYLDFNFLSDEYIAFMQQTKSILEVQVRLKEVGERIIESMQRYSCGTVKWNLIVSENSDIECLDNWTFPKETFIQIHPFYSGDNLLFFEDCVFSDLQDILAIPIDRKTIFRHKALNDIFFGKLTIFPSGEVYSNVNHPALGNIQSSSLKELVYKELTEGDVWLKVRGNEKPCNRCINKNLCPSISNYELVIGRSNLCKIKLE